MDELNILLQDIDRLRNNLHKLLNDDISSLQDQEIMSASQMLNAVINKYNEILEKKTK